MHELSMTEAKTRLPELIERALKGEEILIENDSHATVKLVAVKNSGKPQFGSAKGLIEINGDFDAPLADFEPYS